MYWALRYSSGEPVLVPDDPTAVIQWTGASDVGGFAMFAAQRGIGGIVHLLSEREPRALIGYLEAWHGVTGRRSRVVKAPRAFLAANEVKPWETIPIWIPGDDPEPGFFRVSADRAHSFGYRFATLEETLEEVIRTFPRAPSPEVTEGLARQRELELIWQLTTRVG